MDAVEMALATYGRTPASVALMDALGLPHPQAWVSANDQWDLTEEMPAADGDEEIVAARGLGDTPRCMQRAFCGSLTCFALVSRQHS